MKILLTGASAFIMGFMASIPVGAIQVEIIKRSINHRNFQALMVAVGSVIADLVYGCVVLFGLAQFFQNKIVLGYFSLAGSLVLGVLAYITLKGRYESRVMALNKLMQRSRRMSLLTGFSLSIANPVMLFWWLIGAKIIIDFNILQGFTPKMSALFLLFGGLGLISYLVIFILFVRKMSAVLSDKILHKVDIVLGISLIVLSIYFLISSWKNLL